MILIIGIPNSGKTTYSQKFNKVIHFDEIKKVSREIYKYVVCQIRKDSDICIEGVYGSVQRRKELIQASSGKNICIWIDTPLNQCIRREQTGRQRSVHMVRMSAQNFQPPTYDQGWDQIYILKNGVLTKM